MSQFTVPALGAASFDVTFEAVGFTSEDLSGCNLTDTEGEGFTVTAIAENQFPEGVTAVIRGHISEDDVHHAARARAECLARIPDGGACPLAHARGGHDGDQLGRRVSAYPRG